MRKISTFVVLSVCVLALLTPVAHATSNYKYAPDEYVTVTGGGAPNGTYFITAHGEGPYGYGNFHLYLTDAASGKIIGPLSAIMQPLDTGAEAYAAMWSSDFSEVSIAYRIDRHLPLKAVTYRIANGKAELISGPVDATATQIKFWQDQASHPHPSERTFRISDSGAASTPSPNAGSESQIVSTPQIAGAPVTNETTVLTNGSASENLVFQDLDYSKTFAEKNHLIAQVYIAGKPPTRYRFDGYPTSQQITKDGVTYGKLSGEQWKKSKDWGKTGTLSGQSKNTELNFFESLATVFFQKPVSHDPTQGAYIWKKIKEWTNGDAQYSTFELSREHPKIGGIYPVFTFVKYKETPDGQLLIKSCAGNTLHAGVLTPFNVNYDFLVPVNATIEVVNEPPPQQAAPLLLTNIPPPAPQQTEVIPEENTPPAQAETTPPPKAHSSSKIKLFGPHDKFPPDIGGCGLVGTFIPMEEAPGGGILVVASDDAASPLLARKFIVENKSMGYPPGTTIPVEKRKPLHSTRSHPLIIIRKGTLPGFYYVKTY